MEQPRFRVTVMKVGADTPQDIDITAPDEASARAAAERIGWAVLSVRKVNFAEPAVDSDGPATLEEIRDELRGVRREVDAIQRRAVWHACLGAILAIMLLMFVRCLMGGRLR
jgi:hypothetical protein